MKDEEKNSIWRLGEILVRTGAITWKQLDAALRLQRKSSPLPKKLIPETDNTTEKEDLGWRLGEILVRHGALSWERLEEGLDIQRKTGKLLGKILQEKGYVKSRDLFRALAVQFKMTFIDFQNIHIQEEAVRLVPKSFAYDHQVMPLALKGESLLIATSNPMNVWPESELRGHIGSGYEIHSVLACPEEIDAALYHYYGPADSSVRPQ
jgi:type IV pilus assembly protein PilB